MNPHIFREYDIRGVAETDLDDETIRLLGLALGTRLGRRSEADDLQVGVGRDIRDSSDRLFEALASGLRETGAEVVDIGVVPTPLVYFATYQHGFDGSVQITGSHNPAEYNGFKMMEGHGPLYGETIQDLRQKMEEEDFDRGDEGELSRLDDPKGEYIDWVAENIEPGDHEVRVALDSGNGTAGLVAPDLVR
ncbi:MAG: phosphomannomutase, partial [Bradymonadaceae bacterium]